MRFLFTLALSLSAVCYSNSQELKKKRSLFSVEAITTFPVVVGAGVNYHATENFLVNIGAGVTPQPYYSFIGTMAAQYGGNSAYKDVIEAAFQNNSLIRISSLYNLSGDYKKFGLGGVVSQLKSSGTAGIDKVLAASNGRDYTSLKNLLIAAGRNPNVDIDSTLLIAEIYANYRLVDNKNFLIDAQLGFTKVMTAEVHFKTGLSNFESTTAGNNLMRSSESDTEDIITQYGMAPTIGIKAVYLF
jgi:hypothetical protein